MARRRETFLPAAPTKSATAAGLRYIPDTAPGYCRVRVGRGFRYFGVNGRQLRDRSKLERIRKLAIPPAWREVWICSVPQGHLQATGRDTRGRKQYRYHPLYRQVRDETKYGRMLEFAKALPAIRKQVARHLSLQGLPREKVLAALTRLLESTLIRVGNLEYKRANGSFGLTTLHDRHVRISGSRMKFRFQGKSRHQYEIELQEPRLARIVKNCKDLPGYELFQYLDEENKPCTIDSAALNDYLHTITNQDFTAKDFRTWAGTVHALMVLRQCGPCSSKRESKKNIVAAIQDVAHKLGNGPAICRKYYVHPALLEAYTEGWLFDVFKRDGKPGLRREERCVVSVLRRQRQARGPLPTTPRLASRRSTCGP